MPADGTVGHVQGVGSAADTLQARRGLKGAQGSKRGQGGGHM